MDSCAEAARTPFPHRDIFIWVSAIILINQLFRVLGAIPATLADKQVLNLNDFGIFQLIAWYAIFRLFIASDSVPVARTRDFVIAIALCVLVFLPSTRMIWGAALGLAVLTAVSRPRDAKLRAAGVVLAALSVQEYWGRIFFDFFALPLLRAETAVIGTILQAVRPGTQWEDNAITAPDGDGIVMYSGCSSFHNLSLATLCWLAVSRLRNQDWKTQDLAVGSLIGALMILFNITRVCLMAWNADLFHAVHDGIGAQIFDIGASMVVLLVSLQGSRRRA